MRTTLDIDIDVLQAAKDLARREGTTAGAVISSLARKGLAGPAITPAPGEARPLHGFRPFPRRGGVVTNALIDKLREDDVH
ncbi:MAG: antitoxin [Casimicrobiaceae bacterium]